MNAKRLLVAGLILVAPVCTAVAGDRAAGEAIFKSRCVNCHSLTPGLSTIAPDLGHVVGRKVASLKDYKYSQALREADFVWTPEKLNQWLASPHKIAAETEMTFAGLPSEKERADVVEFLKQYAPNK